MGEHSDAFHTVFGDYVAGEYLVVFLDVGGEHIEELVDIFNEVGGEILHEAADALIVESHAGTASFLHNVENLFANAESIEQHCGCAEVHAICADEEAVGSNARELVHDHADHLSAARDLNAGSLLDGHTEAVVVWVGREVVRTIHEVESPGISELLADLLDATVDVAAVEVDLLDGLTVDSCTETEHAVSGRVLRADVDNKVFGGKHTHLLFDHLS